jgi:hypothetical protein
VASYTYTVSGSTVSGSITSSGTLLPDGTVVSGSINVNFAYSYTRPTASGNDYITTAKIHAQDALDLKTGLLAYHPFIEKGTTISDRSGNNYTAIVGGDVPAVLGKKDYGRTVGVYPYGTISVPTFTTRSGSDYMLSFFFQPKYLMTSGNLDSFRMIVSDAFYGDHFATSINYKTGQGKGWYLLNSAVTCQAAYGGGSSLRFQGNANTSWFNTTWNASTLYFNIDKSKDWDIETELTFGTLASGQSAGLIFFSKSNYYDYCSMLLTGKTSSSGIDIKLKTRNYSYDGAVDIPVPSGGLTTKLGLKKRGNTVYFRYLNSNNSWVWPIYYMDCSTWSGTQMGMGLQTSNAAGTAPQVDFNYLAFTRGIKPDGMGDSESDGRLIVSYNEVDVDALTQERTDSRLWFQTGRKGIAFGSATYVWDPSMWYLVQFGIKSTGESVVRINATDERCLPIGSGTASTTIFTPSGLNYFDPYPQPPSGAFILDEVSHWNRWLSNEESLKLIYNMSQTSWHYAKNYISSSLPVAETSTTRSGAVSMREIATSFGESISQLTSAPPESKNVIFKKISYRIQDNIILHSQSPPSSQLNILRCSSGFMGKNRGCWGCLSDRTTGPCHCDVYGEATIVRRDRNYPSVNSLLYSIPRTMTKIQPNYIVTGSGLTATYKQSIYDVISPQILSTVPEANSSMTDPLFDWLPYNKSSIMIRDYGSNFMPDGTRVWIKHNKKGSYYYGKADNFSFYEMDFSACPPAPTGSGVFLTSVSGHGWGAVNVSHAVKMQINKGFSSIIDAASTTNSGVHTYITNSGIETNLAEMKSISYHATPAMAVFGSRVLEIMTESGSWNPTTQEAPFVYWNIPSGVNQWTVESPLTVYRTGDPKFQWAGLMLTSLSSPQTYYQLVLTTSGVHTVCNTTNESLVLPLTRSSSDLDKAWVRIEKDGSNNYSFKFSEDASTWIDVPPFTMKQVIPTFSGSNTLGSNFVFASYDSSNAWKPFDGVLGDSSDFWNGYMSGYGSYAYLGFYLVNPVIVYYYQLCGSNDIDMASRGISNCPWSIQGSNDNTNWTTLDSQLGQYDVGKAALMPGSNQYYKIQTPGWYKYYRIYFSNPTAPIATTAKIGQLKMFGNDSTTVSGLIGDIAVGPVVRSERTMLGDPQNLMPLMTSNTAPSGYVISSNIDSSNAYMPFDVNKTGTGWTGTFLNPTWLKISLPAVQTLTHYRFTNRGYYSNQDFMTDWTLQGSNDDISYDIIHTVVGWSGPGWGVTSPFFYIPNPKSYKYYKLNITGTLSWYGAVGLANLEFWGYPTDINLAYTPGQMSVVFDSVKLTASGEATFVESNDDWELLLDWQTPVNSSKNSGYTSFSTLGSQTYKVDWQPKVPLDRGEKIYYRVESCDAPSFKVDYTISPNTILFLSGDTNPDVPVNSTIGTVNVDSTSYIYDKSTNPLLVYPKTSTDLGGHAPYSRYPFTTTSGYSGTGAIKFGGNPIYTSTFSGTVSDWTFHTWLYREGSSEKFKETVNLFELTSSGYSYKVTCSGNYINMYGNSALLGSSGPYTIPSGVYTHVAIVKENHFISTFISGRRPDSAVYTPNSTVSGNCYLTLGEHLFGLMDEVVFESSALWDKSIIYSNYLDTIYSFKIADWEDLSVGIDVVNDTASPVVVPLGPLHQQINVCPASGIVFDILDDYSGVKWEETVINIGDFTVFSGGNNMTEFFSDRGVLTWEERGQLNGEWGDALLTPSGIVCPDGINRQVYPPGTIYNDSGAWGRRFTYHVPESSEAQYFAKHMDITISGTDSVGYGSRFDNIYPNAFAYNYYFDFIPNDNLKFGDVFLNQGESIKITEAKARGMHFWVDLADYNYPATDIVENDCSLVWFDGVNEFTCSGIWFTTWTGNEWTGASGVIYHRMHWDPQNDWNWEGNRSIHLTVESHNNNPTCSVYNTNEYVLYYGWELAWFHQAIPKQHPPFEFNKKFPIFLSMKTYDFGPSRFNKSYMLWSSPGYTQDLSVYINPRPRPKKDLKVGILAQSPYLQYSEDVEVEVSCRDKDGNELVYTWNFRTQDQ